MISSELRTLASYFLDRHDTGIVMEQAACLRVGKAIQGLAARALKMEVAAARPAAQAKSVVVPPAAYAHLVCKEPPWGWGEKVTAIKEAPAP